jgi:hypothetical protein
VASVLQQTESADGADCHNIASRGEDRGLLAQKFLAQLRNLLETVVVTPRGQQ